MHRSMTSLVAGGIHNFGAHMGDQMIPPDSSNPKGHFEDAEFKRLNERILSSAGGTWCDPPSEIAIMSQKNTYDLLIQKLVERKKRDPIWGWKDPRTTLTIKLFVPYLKNPHFVCCFRDPVEVAKSLQVRNKFSIEKGLQLAEIYNQRLLEFLQWYYF